jgi:hypothetical protein
MKRIEGFAFGLPIHLARALMLLALVFLPGCHRGSQRVVVPSAVTAPAISARDLKTRLYALADDSMEGRETATEGNRKATDYVASEFQRAGLMPAGENGTYFQNVPVANNAVSESTTLLVGSDRLTLWKDFAIFPDETSRSLEGVTAIYGGFATDSSTWISESDAAGRLVVFAIPDSETQYVSTVLVRQATRFRRSAAVAIAEFHIIGDRLAPWRASLLTFANGNASGQQTPRLVVSREAAIRLLGLPPGSPLRLVSAGRLGPPLHGGVVVSETPAHAPVRNVVALIPGSDASLRGELVVIGAHNDHVGAHGPAVDHDSVRAFNTVVRPQGEDSDPRPGTAEELASVKHLLDSLRRIHPPRLDSVYNGADDDGSGTVALLEIAESMAHASTRPKRSILFVSHTGEEEGLWGSTWFTDHPTVPRDSIVAQLNIDMIGRGDASDLKGGGPQYLQLIGSRRLSTELGELIEATNSTGAYGLEFDYEYDKPGDPQQYYCRSDHAEYARYGIPVAFFSTGGHQDYHELTDEPEYIDYPKMSRIVQLVNDVALRIANLDHRLAVDKVKPDPAKPCVQ